MRLRACGQASEPGGSGEAARYSRAIRPPRSAEAAQSAQKQCACWRSGSKNRSVPRFPPDPGVLTGDQGYLQRWRIENFFRVLKSGCRVEHLAFRTVDRLQRAIAIDSVIAWGLMAMTQLGRQVPDCAAELLFTDSELSFLSDYAEEFRLPGPDRLGPAVWLVAHLGGYRGRKQASESGTSSSGTATTR